jgi:hypothetical protein
MTDGIWRHISHLWYMGIPVPLNGVIVEGNNELLMIDTPYNNQQTDSLLRWAKHTFPQSRAARSLPRTLTKTE